MESNIIDIHHSDKTKLKENYNPNSHIIIEKNLFNCIICYDITLNVYETSCCGSLICHNCKPHLQNDYCPLCKIRTDFKISKIAKRLISNSITECPLCDFTDKYDRIASHFFREHKEYILNSKLEQDDKIFNFLSVHFCITFEKKFFMHNHSMLLVSKEKDCVCYAGSVLRYKTCKMVDPNLKETQMKEEYSNTIDEVNQIKPLNDDSLLSVFETSFTNTDNNFSEQLLSPIIKQDESIQNKSSNVTNNKLTEIEELKNMILQRLIYSCSQCKGFFCESCLEGKDIWIPVKVHAHPLNLTTRNTGWGCDGRNCEAGCLSGEWPSYGWARYRCSECDFDLCEKCLIHYRQ